jgi:branched-chain amino acid transport system permease protein
VRAALLRWAPAAGLLALAALGAGALGGYALTLLVLVGLQALAALGLTLLMGQAGQVSLAQGAFYGLGAYASGVLALRAGVPPAASIPAAIFLAAALALLLGLPSLRLGGHHLALATLGFGLILFLVFNEADAWTGGPSGLAGIPPLELAGRAVSGDRASAVVVWTVLAAALGASGELLRSRVGRALRAVAASEVAAASSGVDVGRTKLVAFVLAGALAAAAGALYAHWMTFVSPTAFGIDASIELLVMAVVGGLGHPYGALLGAATVTLLVEGLRGLAHAAAPGATGWVEIVAFGAILVAVLLVAPGGLAGAAERAWSRARRARPGEEARGG